VVQTWKSAPSRQSTIVAFESDAFVDHAFTCINADHGFISQQRCCVASAVRIRHKHWNQRNAQAHEGVSGINRATG